jgi:hypothetical protein
VNYTLNRETGTGGCIMEISLFLAKVMGSYLLIVGLALLTRRRMFMGFMKESSGHMYVVYLFSFVAVIMGLLVVNSHNLWVADWRVLITIAGWLILIKGLILMFFPVYTQKLLIWRQEQTVVLTLISIFILLMGAYLAYHGFIYHL